MLSRLEQDPNKCGVSMDSELLRAALFKLVQKLKAPLSIVSTELGMVMLVKLEQ